MQVVSGKNVSESLAVIWPRLYSQKNAALTQAFFVLLSAVFRDSGTYQRAENSACRAAGAEAG